MSIAYKIAYLKHQLTAKNRHGTHSPFVYHLADEVIYDFLDKKVYAEIENQLKKLSADQEPYMPKRVGRLIYRITAHFKPRSVLQINVKNDWATGYLINAALNAKHIVVAQDQNIVKSIQHVWQNRPNLNVLSNFELGEENYAEILKPETKLDLVYVSNHRMNGAFLKYFELLLDHIHAGTVMIIENIYWNEESKKDWEVIQDHPAVRVTIDLFWIGLVFFKKGQAKEHFKLKF